MIPATRLRPALIGSALIAVLLLVGVAVQVLGSDLASRTYVVFLLNVILVVSFQVFIGNGGIVSFGHIAFMGVGAYLTALIAIPVGIKATRAVVRRPVLLLDEPAAGMNESESDELLQNIRRIRTAIGCSVVVVDHDLRLIMELCDRIQVLDQGKTIAIGRPDEVANDPAVVEAYLGGASARSA